LPGKRILSSTRYEQGPQYSPDGKRIVFASNRSGYFEIWVSDVDGNRATQLTNFNESPTGTPYWSPDGRWIAFDSRPLGNPDVYVVSVEGGKPRQLTDDPTEEIVPTYSRDGEWLYVTSNRTGAYQLFKMPAAGGPMKQITFQGGFHGIESLDGKHVYYSKSNTEPGLWRVPSEGGAEEPVIPEVRAGFWAYWAPSREGIYYLDREELPDSGVRYLLKFYSFATQKIETVAPMERRPFNSGLSVSPDGKRFLYTQADQSYTDIMLVNNFR
jgi:Tol biopolymer transport system component